MNRKYFSAALVALSAAAALTLAPESARAGGLAITENDSVVSGRAYIGATLDNSSAVFNNPANLPRLEGLELRLGATAMMPRWRYAPAGGSSEEASKFSVSPPPSFSVAYNLGDAGFGTLAAGFGFDVPYGSGFSWPNDWIGRGELQAISLMVYELTPVIAWQPHEKVSVGAGFRYMPASVYLKKAVSFGTEAEGTFEGAGTGAAYGATVGVSAFPIDGLRLAFVWRPRSTVRMSGNGNFDFEPPFDTKANDRPIKTQIPLAQIFRLAAAYDVLPNVLNVSAQVEHQRWGAFQELALELQNPDGTVETQASPRDSQNSWLTSVSGEYKLSDAVRVRGGYVFDLHTLPDYTVNPGPPDSNRHIVTLGASYLFDRYGVHVHGENVFFTTRKSSNNPLPGEWRGYWPLNTMAYVIGASFSMALDAPVAFTARPAAERPVSQPEVQNTETVAPAPAAPVVAPAPAVEPVAPAAPVDGAPAVAPANSPEAEPAPAILTPGAEPTAPAPAGQVESKPGDAAAVGQADTKTSETAAPSRGGL